VAVETADVNVSMMSSGSGVETVRMRFHHLHAADAETWEKVCSFGSRRTEVQKGGGWIASAP
jgi:hypothetical protein